LREGRFGQNKIGGREEKTLIFGKGEFRQETVCRERLLMRKKGKKGKISMFWEVICEVESLRCGLAKAGRGRPGRIGERDLAQTRD